MGEPAVLVDGLSEAYRRRSSRGWRRPRGAERWALEDVSVSVEPGASLGVIGPNGSGKTTLLRCIAGLIAPTRGSMRTTGRVVSLIDPSAGFHRELTGRENALVDGVLCGMSRMEVHARLDAIAAYAGLNGETFDAPLMTYTAGLVVRLGFSVIVHSDPRVLVIDEVLGTADEAFKRRALDRLDELTRGGAAVVLASHDLDLVLRTCDQVAVLAEGRLLSLGPTHETLEAYRHRMGDASAARAGRPKGGSERSRRPGP